MLTSSNGGKMYQIRRRLECLPGQSTSFSQYSVRSRNEQGSLQTEYNPLLNFRETIIRGQEFRFYDPKELGGLQQTYLIRQDRKRIVSNFSLKITVNTTAKGLAKNLERNVVRRCTSVSLPRHPSPFATYSIKERCTQRKRPVQC